MPQENVTFQQLFDQALSAQQQKKADEALQLYKDALAQSQNATAPNQLSVIYHNMSTLAFEKANPLQAYIWSRKAVALDPGSRMAQQSLDLYAKKFEVPMVAHQISGYQNLQKVISQVPIDVWFGLILVTLFTTLRLFFRGLILRRQNQLEVVPARAITWKPFASLVVLLLVLAATAVSWKHDQIRRALLIDKTGIQTAAGEGKSVIFEAQPGTEVEVLQISETYAQVRYPGAFSGWVPLQNLELLFLK